MTTIELRLDPDAETCERLAFSYNFSGTYRLAYNTSRLGLKCTPLSPEQKATFCLYAAIALNHLGLPQSATRYCQLGLRACPPGYQTLQVLLLSQLQWAISTRIKKQLIPTGLTPEEYPRSCAFIAEKYFASGQYQQLHDISLIGLQSTPLDTELKAQFCLYMSTALLKLRLPGEALQFAQQGIEAKSQNMNLLANLNYAKEASQRDLHCLTPANSIPPLLHRMQNWNV
jgi:hypothetical protein